MLPSILLKIKKLISFYYTIIVQFILAVLFSGFSASTVFGQAVSVDITQKQSFLIHPDSLITFENFSDSLLLLCITEELNKFRLKLHLDIYEPSDVLNQAAAEQVLYNVTNNSIKSNRDIKGMETLRQRLIHFGGSGYGFDINERKSLQVVADVFSYNAFAADMVLSWVIRGTYEKFLIAPQNILLGIDCKLLTRNKNIFITVIVGSYLSENSGVQHLSELSIKIPKTKSNIKIYDPKACNSISRLTKNENFQNLLSVDNGEVMLDYTKNKSLGRIIRLKTAGFAFDLVFKEQYVEQPENLVDYSESARGIVSKVIKSRKLNRKTSREKNNTTAKSLGKLPNNLPDDNYELNLIITQNNHVCTSFSPYYLENITGNYNRPLDILADTITVNSEFNYHPRSDTTVLKLKIPFDNKKYTYKESDIIPLLNVLDDFDLVIHEIKITAYSSIEGNVFENEILQQKRAESIVAILNKRYKSDIISDISTSPNWEQFKIDILQTKYNILSSMSMAEVQEYIKNNNLNKELEHIFKNHRYSQVEIVVSYDISGNNEQKYVLNQFQTAINNKNLPLALSIQKYIIKSVYSGRYPSTVIQKQQIPKEKTFAGLLMNQLYMQIKTQGQELIKYKDKIHELYTLAQGNAYISYNDLLVQVLFDSISDSQQIANMQSRIQSLYRNTISKETVDALNIQFQFKILQTAETFKDGKRVKQEAINRMKEAIDIRDESPENMLKLAGVFMEQHDYMFTLELLDAFIDASYSEELVFTWLSLCSVYPDRMLTRKFAEIIERAYQINDTRLMNLFDGKHFSYRVFENPNVKAFYMNKNKSVTF